MARKISFANSAREKLLRGTEALAKAVSSTLGPLGHNVTIDRGFDIWTLHDGVNVAKQIELKDPEENVGLRMLREAANKQVQEVGDGTTVVTVLGNAIVQECHKVITGGTHAMLLRKGLEEGQQLLSEAIDSQAIPVKTLEQKIQIATISAENDELGKMIGETIDKIGDNGIITVEESKSSDTYIEILQGMQYEQGYISPLFVTDPDRMEATVEKPVILITDMVVSNFNELLPWLVDEKGITKIGKNLVVIAQDVTDSALTSFIATKLNGGMSILATKAPYVGQKLKDFLQDIAITTGGQVITEDAGHRLDQVTLGQLGRADRVTSTADATIIVGGNGNKDLIQDRVKSVHAQIERNEGSEYEIEKLRERLGKLTNGIAVLFVGGETELEMKERKERALDAVASTQAAVESGIVAGGETIYLAIREQLKKDDIAHKILYNALAQPFKKLVENAGYDGGEKMAELKQNTTLVISKNSLKNIDDPAQDITLEPRKDNSGFDVTDGRFKDMIKAGIIDPAKVSKSAIKNAISVAIQIMTTDTLITEEKEEKKGGNS